MSLAGAIGPATDAFIVSGGRIVAHGIDAVSRAVVRRTRQRLHEQLTRRLEGLGLYPNTVWYAALECSYDMSLPSVAHLDPQRGGCCTLMPFFIGKILELPLTTIQDYSLFHVLNDYSLDLWKQQLASITEAHGLASFLVHPDYLIARRARRTYQALLEHLALMREERKMWMPLPREVDRWWRERSQMKVVCDGGRWRIEGRGKERARLAFATLTGRELTFTIEEQNQPSSVSTRDATSTAGRQVHDH